MPPAPLVITGKPCGELIDEFTVSCGLVYSAGEMNCPVTISEAGGPIIGAGFR